MQLQRAAEYVHEFLAIVPRVFAVRLNVACQNITDDRYELFVEQLGRQVEVVTSWGLDDFTVAGARDAAAHGSVRGRRERSGSRADQRAHGNIESFAKCQ